MAKIVNGQLLERAAVRPLGAESRFVVIALSISSVDFESFVWTPILGDRVFLQHVWIDGQTVDVADFHNNITFELNAVNDKPKTVAEARTGELVLPIFFKDAVTRFSLGGSIWQLDYSINKFFEGPSLRFALFVIGVVTGVVRVQVAFQYMISEV